MRRPTELKSQKAASTRQRRRRGSTSPPLVGVETNPGPHQKKSTRRAAKPAPAPLDHNFTEQDKTKLQQLLDEGLTIEEIMRRTRWTKETVIRWSVRYQDTGKMETRKRPGCPPKRRQGKETDIDAFRCLGRISPPCGVRGYGEFIMPIVACAGLAWATAAWLAIESLAPVESLFAATDR